MQTAKRCLVVILMLSLWALCNAQQPELSPALKQRIPLKAAGLSLLLPGGGQVYNQQYVKAGIVIALEGLCIGYAVYHDDESDKYFKRYKETNSSLDYAQYERFYEKRQSDLFWLGTVIFLSALDAFVDAHLYNFEYNRSKVRIKFDNNSLQISFRF
jgi:hypothetical protein